MLVCKSPDASLITIASHLQVFQTGWRPNCLDWHIKNFYITLLFPCRETHALAWGFLSPILFLQRITSLLSQGKRFQYECLMRVKSACNMLFILLSNKAKFSNLLPTAVTSYNLSAASVVLRGNGFQHLPSSDKLITRSTKNSRLQRNQELKIIPKSFFFTPLLLTVCS